jgi:hypothetical protein
VKPKFTISVLITAAIVLLAVPASSQTQWRRATQGAFQGIAFNPHSHGETIYAASYDSIGIFRSDDHGLTWARYFDGLEPFSTSDIRQIYCVPTDTNVVLALSPRKLYRSTNGGRNWVELDGLGGIEGEDIDYQEATDLLYYGQNFRGPVWRSGDHGATWVMTGAAVDSIGLCTIAVSPDLPTVLLAGSEGGELARSTEEGMNWTIQMHHDTGTDLEPEVPKIVYSKFAVGVSGLRTIALCTRWPSLGNAIVKTVDNGVSWTSLHHPSKNPWALEIDQRASTIAAASNAAYPGPLHYWTGLFHDRSDTVTNGLIQETTDGGLSWHTMNFPTGIEGDPNNPMTRDVWVMKFDTTSGRLIASTSTGVWIAETRSSVRSTANAEIGYHVRRSANGVEVMGATRLVLFDMLGREVCGAQGATLGVGATPHGCYTLAITLVDRVVFERVIL